LGNLSAVIQSSNGRRAVIQGKRMGQRVGIGIEACAGERKNWYSQAAGSLAGLPHALPLQPQLPTPDEACRCPAAALCTDMELAS